MKYYALVLCILGLSCSKKDSNNNSQNENFQLQLDGKNYSWRAGTQVSYLPGYEYMNILTEEQDHSILMGLSVHNDTLGTYRTTSTDTLKALTGEIEFIESEDPHYGRWKMVTNDESRKGTLTVDVFTSYDFRGTFSGVFRNSDDTSRYLTISNGIFAVKMQ